MIHLGYLGYDARKGQAFVPNEEIRQLLGAELKVSGWSEFDRFAKESEALFEATVLEENEKVAAETRKIHDRYASAIWYNNENSLAATLMERRCGSTAWDCIKLLKNNRNDADKAFKNDRNNTGKPFKNDNIISELLKKRNQHVTLLCGGYRNAEEIDLE